jgi:uncharacterized protein YjaZ
MKIPKKFTLAGLKWTVEETNNISEMGHCAYNECVIRLKKDLSPQMKAATFCHELQHAIRFATGKFDHDEVEVDAQGNMLHQFLEQYGR